MQRLQAEGARWIATIDEELGLVRVRYRSKNTNTWQEAYQPDIPTAEAFVAQRLGEAHLLNPDELIDWKTASSQ